MQRGEGARPALGSPGLPTLFARRPILSVSSGDVSFPPTWNSRKLTGSVLGKTYRVESRIGTGSMGAVYDVVHIRFGRHFAAKVLSPVICKNERALQRFKREAMVTSSLGNPHILRIFDFNEMEDGTPYIIMELLRGEDLAERLERDKRLPLPLVTRIFQQAASALHDAHDKGIIHRDLKPQNIFLCRDEEGEEDYVKIVDFGISKILGARDAVTGTHELLGSPAFMSPEQAMVKASEVDLTADVFAMGAILYMMLTGRPPFWAENVQSVLYNIVHEPPPRPSSFNSEVTPEVEKVIARALSKAREDRYQSMEDFSLEFARAAEIGDATADTPKKPGWLDAPTTVDPRRSRERVTDKMQPVARAPDSGEVLPAVGLNPEPALITLDEDLRPMPDPHDTEPGEMSFNPGASRSPSGELDYEPGFYQQETMHIREAAGFHEAATVIQDVAIDEEPTAEVKTTIPPPPRTYELRRKGGASVGLKVALVVASLVTLAVVVTVVVMYLR